jgi:Zn-dependent peptidase ImmA (M78 family)/DNA-binding XRE family transcriptional regulator
VSTERFNGDLVALAREARGLTQTELARRACVGQGTVSKLENGLLEQPSEEAIARLAGALRYPPEFFFQNEPLASVGGLMFRRRLSLSPKRLRKLEADLNVVRLQVQALLRGIEIQADRALPRLDLEDYGSPSEAARMLRAAWRLPGGPVRDLTATIESAEAIVIALDFGTSKADAAHQWPPGRPAFFFVNTTTPGDRLRFSLAHELGHAVLHHTPTPDPETEANLFAGELLMPGREIKPMLAQGLTFSKLAELKRHWRVSMAALIMRAHQLGAITDRQRRSWFQRLSQRGWRTTEPVQIPREQPRILSEILQIHARDHGYGIAELARLARADVDDLRQRLPLPDARGLHVVR